MQSSRRIRIPQIVNIDKSDFVCLDVSGAHAFPGHRAGGRQPECGADDGFIALMSWHAPHRCASPKNQPDQQALRARPSWRTCSPARCRVLTGSWGASPVSGPGMGASRERVAGPWSACGDGLGIPAYGGHSRAFPLIPRNPRGSPAGRDVGLVGAHGGGLGDPVAG